jgi:hypothetical protein
MDSYKWLGAVSMVFLTAVVALTAFVVTGKHSRKVTYVVSGTALALMLAVTVICFIIYQRFGR